MYPPANQSKPASTGTAPPVMARSSFPVWLMALLLALVTMALYWPVTGHDFINFDDPGYVTANPHVQGGLTWESTWWALTTLHLGLWHPLTWISHMLDCQWFGLRPGWHHLTSLLLHAANTALLFVVLRGMTGALWRSAFVAALFALHPLHVESVAWAAERKDVLSTFFVMLTLWAYYLYATEGRRQSAECGMPKPATPNTSHATRNTQHVSRFAPPASAFYLLSLFCFALGLMSKPMIVTLPLVMLLLDYWPLRRFELSTINYQLSTLRRLLMEKLPFLLAAFLTGLVTLRAGHQAGSLPSAAHFPMAGRVANATLSYARYFRQVFWPGKLAMYYPFPATFSAWSVAGAALTLTGISVAAVCLARRRPYVVVGWLWYLVTLMPVIGLIQLSTYSHADRYTYVPLIGVFMILVWGGEELVSRWRRPAQACAAAAVGLVILLCLALTRQQIGYWKESETLFRHALEVTESNCVARNNYGAALVEKGQIDEAIRQFREAIRMKPDYALAHNSLGAAFFKKGQLDEAISQYREAIRLNPNDSLAHNNLGGALFRKGQIDEAIAQYQQGLRLQPVDPEAHYHLGNALAKKGQVAAAIGQYQEALRIKPDNADAHFQLGNALATNGQAELAISHLQEAIRLKPDDAVAHNSLGKVLARTGQIDEAISQLREALRLKPNDADAYYNLANALARKGQIDEAISQYRKAISLKPNDADAHSNLGVSLYRKGLNEEAIGQFQEALRLKPDYAEARKNLEVALAKQAHSSPQPGPLNKP